MTKSYKEINPANIQGKLLKEYISFKNCSMESVLFFHLGGFYETYFEDAVIFSETTGVNLTSKFFKETGDIPMAGIPQNSLKIYVKKLIDKNYKVCICEQFTDDKSNVFRKITRTYTKGTIIEDEFLEGSENNYILSLFYKNNKYYLAYADISTGQFYKTKGSEIEIISEIEKINPNEILISENQNDIFKEIISRYNVTFLKEDVYFSSNIENSILEYCKFAYLDFMPKLDKIIDYKIKNYLSMDNITRQNLELTRTKRYLKKKGSLFWFLNYTKTPMGLRFLKKCIDEPLLDINEITQRQNAVSELLKRTDFDKIEHELEQFSDISRLCAKISNSTILPKDLLKITKDIKNIKKLNEISNSFKSDKIKIEQKLFEGVLDLADEIDISLNENVTNEIKTGNTIKEGYNSNLDYMRTRLHSIETEMEKYVASEIKKLSFSNVSFNHSNTIGYYIEIPQTKVKYMTHNYIKKQSLTSCSRYTTDKLQSYEQEIYSLKYKISEFDYELYCKIRKKASTFVEVIRKLAKETAKIDVLYSFAKAAKINNLSKPEFNNNGLYVKNGFHPSLIKLNNEIVKNDLTLENNSMIILTGANMSGKSTYLKYNAIICLLAQIGSFVPADAVNLTIVDKIFLRQGSSDDIINNNSSFMVEMNDLKYILNNATQNSFILLDEPAKSTNAIEGGAIARAYCEYIVSNIKAKAIIATHNLELTKSQNYYPSYIFNYVIGNADGESSNINNRKVKKGVISTSFALNTAILAELPQKIIDNAKAYIV